jgi:hypothetical protein
MSKSFEKAKALAAKHGIDVTGYQQIDHGWTIYVDAPLNFVFGDCDGSTAMFHGPIVSLPPFVKHCIKMLMVDERSYQDIINISGCDDEHADRVYLVRAIANSGLDKSQFANKCEITPETLARFINGTYPITSKVKAAIKEFTDYPDTK